MKLIMENWRKYNDNPFQLMCEQYDKEIITEDQLFENWKEMTLKELDQLNEIDWEKEAARTADPDYKTPQERRGSMILKVKEKINDWILEKSIQIVELGRKAALKAVKAAAWLIGKIQGFCGEHPGICKVATMTLIVVAFTIAMAFLIDNEAQAKLVRGGKPVPDWAVDGMKGQLSDMIDARKESGQPRAHLYKLLAQMDELHQAKNKHEILKSKDSIDKGMEVLYQGLKEAWKQEGTFKGLSQEEGQGLVKRWIDVGERTSAWYREVTYKAKGYLSQTLDYGKTVAKKGAEATQNIKEQES
jgi:hypothetical protein